MNTLLRIGAAIAALLIITTTAEARHRHRHVAYHHLASYESGTIVAHPSGCPRVLFCACGVSMKLWGYAKHMAANAFFRYPKAAAAPGMVAVRSHHVMLIERVDANGNAVVYDPNSGGHKTRVHTRSLAGYSIRNPNIQISRSL